MAENLHVGWAYLHPRKPDGVWHLCKEEPTAWPVRRKVYLADRVEHLERVLSLIAYCDTEGHEHHEPHGLYRSMMVTMAKRALGDVPSYD